VPSAKLSFGDVLSEGYGLFFGRLRLFFQLVTVPWIMSVGIRLLGAALAEDSIAAVLVEKAVDVLPTVMFMAGWQRALLLGPRRLDRPPGLAWTPRETAYLVHLVKIAGLAFVLLAAFILLLGSIDPAQLTGHSPADPELARAQAYSAPLSLALIVSTLLALRVSFGLAATAVDVPFTPRLAWAVSRGNAWTIIAALFLSFFLSALLTAMATLVVYGVLAGMFDAPQGAAVVSWTVYSLVSYAGAGLVATLQAVIFRKLTGWQPGAGLPAIA
jgi:hypothetical protein